MSNLHGKCQRNGVEGGSDEEDKTGVDADGAGVDGPQHWHTQQLTALDTGYHTGGQSTWKWMTVT